MKKIFPLMMIMLSIFAIIFQGCMEQTEKTVEKLVTAPLNTLGFKSDELPSIFPMIGEVFNDTEMSSDLLSGETVIILERYNAMYGSNATQPSLIILMTKYDSTETAAAVFSEYNETLFDTNFSGVVYQRISAEQLGDESAIGNSTSGVYQIVFRKLNVATRFYADVSQDEAIDYAKILISYIESSLS